MPMIDAYIPQGALLPEAEAALCMSLTDILLRAEGFDPCNAIAQSVSVLFLHRPEAVFVAGEHAVAPYYRIVPTVPEGQYDEQAKRTLVKEVTAAVAQAEGTAFDEVAARVWVFPTEVEDGDWGSRGVIRRLPDIQSFIAGESQRQVGEERLARRRRSKALLMLTAMLDAIRRGNAS